MKRLTLLALLALSVAAGPAIAADPPAKKPAATAKKSMAPNGRFHTVHTKKLKFDCGTCHGTGEADTLFLRTGEPQGAGPVDRNVCLGCHQSPSKPTWYGKAK